MREVAAKAHLPLLAEDAVVVADIAVLRCVPVMDSERALALESVVVVPDGVEQTTCPDLVRPLLGIDRHRDIVRKQEQTEMQPGYAGAHDPDARLHRSSSCSPVDKLLGAGRVLRSLCCP